MSVAKFLKLSQNTLGVIANSSPKWRIFLLAFIFFVILPNRAFAEDFNSPCSEVFIWIKTNDGKTVQTPTHFIYNTFKEINYSIAVTDPDENQEYLVSADGDDWWNYRSDAIKPKKIAGKLRLTGTISTKPEHDPGNHRLHVKRIIEEKKQPYCTPDYGDNPVLRYTIDPAPTSTPSYHCSLTIQSENPESRDKITSSDKFNIFIQVIPNTIGLNTVSIELTNLNTTKKETLPARLGLGSNDEYVATVNKHSDGTYSIVANMYVEVCDEFANCFDVLENKCSSTITICENDCGVPTPTPTPFPTPTDADYCNYPPCSIHCEASPNCLNCSRCRPTPNPIPEPKLEALCNRAHPDLRDKCILCVNRPTDNPPGEGGIWTAIGCLPTNYSKLISEKIFPIGLGLAGGIAFLYFIYGCFLILTSAGNAEKVQQGKQIIVSALSGLLFIIFSVFILKVIGVDILRLPGFGPEPK